jgi:hypothetical protein
VSSSCFRTAAIVQLLVVLVALLLQLLVLLALMRTSSGTSVVCHDAAVLRRSIGQYSVHATHC